MTAISSRNESSLLLLLDGILSQDEQSTVTALKQIKKLDPNCHYLKGVEEDSTSDFAPEFEYESPLRSASALEGIIERLLKINPDLAKVASESDGSLPLHFAASIGNIKVAALLLQHYREAALTHNAKGKIPLHYAAREGRVEMVRFLLRLVPLCASTLTKKGKLALHFAAGEGHTEIVRDLLRVHPSGASFPSKKGKVALHFAARWGHIDIARDLCHINPACISTLDYDGSNPLHDATREGQFEMTKFLAERHPPLMYESNIRGEMPLFAAIRSGNVPLCAFLIRLWPESGKQVLQTTSDSDSISSWDPAILTLCLRGAVGNFVDLSPEERAYTDDQSIRVIDRILKKKTETIIPHQPLFDDASYCREVAPSTPERVPDDSYGLIPRSKSPILESGDNGKKRSSASSETNLSKRQRFGYIHGKSGKEAHTLASYENTSEASTFYQVHAALQCSASSNVLDCVLERYPEQHSLKDDYGRLPLHIAISHSRSEGSVDVILERIWKPRQDACFVRDCFGRLPLHLGLMTRADSRLLKVLLDAYPSSGVEPCQVTDEQFSRMMPIQMAISHGGDTSTIFMLMRGDPTIVETWKKRKKSMNLTNYDILRE
eukprot:CAMPEP_0116137322 /NCGR_PEP_ID=MMETSP0329-20121206/12189_1 /TAXON_ID=697910 /ORGANISM="Pseudo-nitzschia arenysensis, Strain B593" /LENGTH=605 /DNA_ID=CAMNT_0003632235 /DNA_START=210 /DNA_END=2027 /DNA_ORIENTATION=+